MKKLLLLLGIVITMSILIFTKEAFGLELEQNIYLNSNNLLDYIKENNIKNIKKFCTTDFCDYLRSTNIEDGIELFKKKYFKYLSDKKNEEIATETILKGFPITKIKTLND